MDTSKIGTVALLVLADERPAASLHIAASSRRCKPAASSRGAPAKFACQYARLSLKAKWE
jgi:hypothetical protein